MRRAGEPVTCATPLFILTLAALLCLSLPGWLSLSPPASGSSPPSTSLASPAAHPASLSEGSPSPAPISQPLATPPDDFDWGLGYWYYNGSAPANFMGEGARMVVDNSRGNLYVFGGEGSTGLTSDTWDYNVSEQSVDQVGTSPSPSPRTNASFESAPQSDFAVLFGGLSDLTTQTTSNDTWIFYYSNTTWFNVTHPLAPPARESAAFAVNDSAGAGSALLEGGWTPKTSLDGGTASVLWSDTWSLNLTSFNWTLLHPAHAPPPMFGAGLLWQNATDRYDLFGGCSYSCSAALWTYASPGVGAAATWQTVSTEGAAPSPRAAEAWAWDGEDQLAVAWGGFTWSPSGPTALGDGFFLSPSGGNSWSPVPTANGPGPRFDAPAAWADFPGCVGLNLNGGNVALNAPPTNYSILQPVGTPSNDCLENEYTGGGSPPPPPCQGFNGTLSLRVTDKLTGAPIAGATVTVVGRYACISNALTTNAAGYLNESLAAPDFLNITVNAVGYRGAALTDRPFPSNVTTFENFTLLPLPSLHIRAWGRTESAGTSPLPGTVISAEGSELGTSNASGWVNASAVDLANGSKVVISGTHPGWFGNSTTVIVPDVGPVEGNVTLLEGGALAVEAVDATTGLALAGAVGSLTDNDTGGGNPVHFATTASGWWNQSELVAGNYSVALSVTGYVPKVASVFHPWLVTTTVVVRLSPEVGAQVGIDLRNAQTGLPIADGQVTFGSLGQSSTDAAGWANFSGLKPPGNYFLTAAASGYVGNNTYVTIEYGSILTKELNLTPISVCDNPAGCGTPAVGPPAASFGFLPSGGLLGALIFATPIAILAVTLLYVLLRPVAPAAPNPPPTRRSS
ncbi:MAG: hypothetical protein L3K03_06280 [Thermoplasmata archaeon]|nr:hypothetical protein [Thermoplasmata archaeon]